MSNRPRTLQSEDCTNRVASAVHALTTVVVYNRATGQLRDQHMEVICQLGLATPRDWNPHIALSVTCPRHYYPDTTLGGQRAC